MLQSIRDRSFGHINAGHNHLLHADGRVFLGKRARYLKGIHMVLHIVLLADIGIFGPSTHADRSLQGVPRHQACD